MAILWTDGDFTAASAISNPVFESPIPGVSTAYVLRQQFMQTLTDFEPEDMGATHPDYATFLLVSEGPREDARAGIVQWVRTYAAKPAQHTEYEQFPYSFIGFFGATGQTNIEGRDRLVKAVMSKLVYDYYLIGGMAGADYATPDLIPQTLAQKYYWGTDSEDPYMLTDYLADSPPFTTATTPTRTTYQGWVAGGAYIVAEDSRIARWMGPIWQRVTRSVVAQ